MTDATNKTTKQLDAQLDSQLVEHWLNVYKTSHEIGLMAQRNLEMMHALPGDNRLFLTRKERRGKVE